MKSADTNKNSACDVHTYRYRLHIQRGGSIVLLHNLSRASDCIVSYPPHISIPTLILEGTSPHHCEEPVNVKVGVCITSVCACMCVCRWVCVSVYAGMGVCSRIHVHVCPSPV